jgi:hypothetical protein
VRKKNKKKYKNKTSAIVFSKTATSLLCCQRRDVAQR